MVYKSINHFAAWLDRSDQSISLEGGRNFDMPFHVDSGMLSNIQHFVGYTELDNTFQKAWLCHLFSKLLD
jgi:hypothetical protein